MQTNDDSDNLSIKIIEGARNILEIELEAEIE